tara:strand:+ start:2402 stop:3334 length:933 start_codon:yes stop_codon:yes gene_type:complete
LDTNSFTDLIKQKCLDVGFSKSGIAPVQYYQEDKIHLEKWIDNGYHASMNWMKNNIEKRTNISNYYQDSKSVISVAINYFTGNSTEEYTAPFISNYALGKDYHIIIKSKLKILLEEIQKIDKDIVGYYCVDTSPIMEKAWAQRAGIGWIGKHTNLITREFGSWVFLGELIINKELSYDSPFSTDLCGTCNLCIDECPTDAIVEPYNLDSNKCISYVTIEHKGDFEEKNMIDLNDWIFGCDICQEVCPWNIKFSEFSNEKDFFDRYSLKEKDYKFWENLTEEEFRKIFKNSPVKRTKYSGLKRNISEAKHK